MTDVRSTSGQVKQTFGPIDELRAFSLEDLRRLGKEPSVSVTRLREKLSTLMKDSYLLYVEGVTAWQESPLYRAYQSLLLESLRDKKPLEAVLSEGHTLTADEFHMIAEFSAELM